MSTPDLPFADQARAAVTAGRLVAFRVRRGMLLGRPADDPCWELVAVLPEGLTLPLEVDGRDWTSRAALSDALARM